MKKSIFLTISIVFVLLFPFEVAAQGMGGSQASSGGGAPTNATYITQTPNDSLSNEQALSDLGDGMLKHSSGVAATASPGTDYSKPGTVPTGAQLIKAPAGFTDGDTTPSVSGGNHFYTQNTGATIITMFDNGTAAQWIYVEFRDGNTTVDFTGTNLIGNHGVDVPFNNGEWLLGRFDGTNWECFIYHNALPVSSFSDAVTMHDDGDNTKKLAFQLSGITTGNTRTCTIPDGDFTLPSGTIVGKDTDHDIWQSVTVDPSAFSVDGSVVTTPAEQTINSGPKTYVADCSSDGAGTFEFKIPNMPENWDGGSIIIELALLSDEGTPAGTIEWDMSIQARGNDETVNNTWVTTNGEIYFEDAETSGTTVDTQYDVFHCKNKTAMAASGAGGDTLFVKGTRDDDDATHDTSIQGVLIVGATVFFQIDDMDEKD